MTHPGRMVAILLFLGAMFSLIGGCSRDRSPQPTGGPAAAERKTAADAADWAMFRGDPHLTGVARCVLPDKLVKRWTYETGDVIQSSAAIVGGTVFVGSDDGVLHAIDLASGKRRWKFEAGFAIRSSPTVYKGVVYFGDEEGIFHAVNAADGKERWRYATEGEIISSANCVDDRIVFGSYDEIVRCLSLEGKLMWQFATEGRMHGTPAIVDGRALVAGCDGFLRAIDISSGEETARINLDSYTGASPAVFGEHVYLGTFGEQVLAVNWKTGEPIWYYEHPTRKFPYLSSAAVNDQAVVIGGRDKIIRALNRADGTTIWEYMTKARVDSSPVISGERVYFSGGEGKLYAFEISSGRKVWEFDTGAPMSASPAIGGGCLVIGTEDGLVYCFSGKDE